MIIKKFSLIILSLLLWGCGKESPVDPDRIVIGISSDIASLNPLFAFSVDEGSITELLFLSLVDFKWDEEKGGLKPGPMLAESWEWSNDSASVTFNLRDDVYWSDGRKFHSGDVVFSFDAYSDSGVQSRLYGTFTDFYTDESNHIDLNKTFEVIDSFKIKINFLPNSTPSLFETVFHIIPEHVFGKMRKKDIATAEENFKPVTLGPFALDRWERNQHIRLKVNKESFLYNPEGIREIIFKIVPDYNSRLTQLKKGELDLLELVKTEDIKELRKNKNLEIARQKGREYDYVGWSNIDHEYYRETGKIQPHKLFGSPKVRKALTCAINSEEILDEYLLKFGQLAAGPVSPIFKEAFDTTIKPYGYDPEKSRLLLASEGWKDNNGDGILEKGDLEFRFKLFIPSGNPRRSYAATIIKNGLRQIGIETTIESVEPGLLVEDMFEKKIDAWMIGWYVAIPLDLKFLWYSDFETATYNFAGYQNKEADKILDKISRETNTSRINDLYKQFQNIIYEDSPVTFLYWIDNIIVYNKRLDNLDINPLGVVHHCWEWTVRR